MLHLSPATKRLRAEVPGEPGYPIVGKTFDFLRDPLNMGLALYDRYGPVQWIFSLGQTHVLAIGPDALQSIFRNSEQAYTNEAWNFFIGPFFTRGLMLMDFDEHRFHRRVMQAAFKRGPMERYFVNMQPHLRRGVGAWPIGRTMHLGYRLKQLTLDVATEIFMGQRLGRDSNAINRAFVAAVRAGSSPIRFGLPGTRWKKGLDGRKVLEEMFYSRIGDKRAHPGDDLFSRLCEATDPDGNRFTDEDVVNHMIFLMMAAHDTSTITLTSLFYQLAKHPDWQARVREELLSVRAEDLTIHSFSDMPTLDMCMKEAMRVMTPVPTLARRTVKEVDLLGYRLPANTPVTACVGLTHQLPEWWSRPARFDPERFSEARAEHRQHPFLYSPFGGGAHKCIGLHFGEMEIKSIAHAVLTQFRVTIPPDYEMPVDWTALPVAADGLPVRLERLAQPTRNVPRGAPSVLPHGP